jgi:simple sugar transport system substrate-binding protein
VVPNSPESLESVLKRAQEAGIVVITHEAPGIQNAVANIEAFDNKSYGGFQMDTLAACMGGSGEYVHMVGSLTVASHNVWAEGALEQAAAEYPDITRVTDPISSDEDQETAYQRTKELIATYPEIKGFIGAASTDIAGIGRAIQEAGLQDQTCVIGTSTPSTAGSLLEDGSVDVITGWDPALAGEAMLQAAKIVMDGGEIVDGLDLGVAGYESITQDPEIDNNFYGDAWIEIGLDNLEDYPF